MVEKLIQMVKGKEKEKILNVPLVQDTHLYIYSIRHVYRHYIILIL